MNPRSSDERALGSREPQHLYLTTTGRRSGRAREIEIWFTAHDGRYYLVAEHGECAHWVQNVSAEPRVRVRIGRSRFAARARVVNARTEAALVARVRGASERKYGWGDGLVVELTLEPATSGRRPPPPSPGRGPRR